MDATPGVADQILAKDLTALALQGIDLGEQIRKRSSAKYFHPR